MSFMSGFESRERFAV